MPPPATNSSAPPACRTITAGSSWTGSANSAPATSNPVAAAEWKRIEAGLAQRIRALNLFLHDIYHDRRILREGVVPEDLVLQSKGFRPEMAGFEPPGGQYVHVCGTDLIHDSAGEFLV